MNELDQLDGLAAAADEHAATLDPVDPNAPPPAPVLNYETEARGMVDMFAALVTGYAPKCAPLWAQDTKTRIAMAAVPVMEKYGFSLGAIPPELTLIIVAGPVLYQTSKVIAQQMNEDRERAESKKAADVPPATIAPTDTPEMPTAPQTALYQV